MRILIATIGTRGDVQPFLALAMGLKAAGHEVCLCTCPRFRAFVVQHGIEFEPIDEGLLELLDSEFGRAIVENLHGVLGVLRTIPKVLRTVGPIHKRMVADCWTAVEKRAPEMILYHPKMFCVPAFAAVKQVPAILTMLCPFQVPTGESPLFGPSLGKTYNRNTYRLVHRLSKLGTRSYLRDWKRQFDPQGLSDRSGPNQISDGQPIPVIHAYSKSVYPRPSDWPDHAWISGYWFLPNDSAHHDGWEPSEALCQFLNAGPKPVYIGFGSMAGSDPSRLTQIVLSAIEKANVRAIVSKGWGGVVPMESSDEIHVLDSAPHDWLFPRVAAVVHHGGAGTTAAGLRAGCPTVICPFGLDQPFWGRRIEELGVGGQPIAQKRLTPSRLADAIRNVTTRESFRNAAEEIATCLQQEDGVANAIHLIETHFQAFTRSP